MKTCRGLFLVVICAFAVLITAPVEADTPPVEAGKLAAKAWLALVDGGDYARAWETAAAGFRQDVSKDEWIRIMESGRKGLGNVTDRRIVSQKFTRNLPGAPGGDYVVVEYDASFENRNSVVEKITAIKEKGGEWRVSAYIFGY